MDVQGQSTQASQVEECVLHARPIQAAASKLVEWFGRATLLDLLGTDNKESDPDDIVK